MGLSTPEKTSKSEENVLKTLALIPELCMLTGMSEAMRADFRIMKEVGNFTRQPRKHESTECGPSWIELKRTRRRKRSSPIGVSVLLRGPSLFKDACSRDRSCTSAVVRPRDL